LLHLVADKVVSGAFYLGFRKGAFSSSPDNLLNLMKFDANGSLLWETQLRMVFICGEKSKWAIYGAQNQSKHE